jgi:hypothetical protein
MPTLGGAFGYVMGELGYVAHDWQRHAADVSLQLTRRRVGRGRARVSPRRLASRTVTVLLGRQGGKTAWAKSRAWLQCLLPSLDGVAELVGGPVGPQRVGWLAQDRASALRAWLEALDRLMASPFGELVHKPRLQRGDESVRFTNGSTLRVITPSRTGPRGLALDCIVLDEALAHHVDLLKALAPTQAQRDSNATSIGAQMVALSSAPSDEQFSSLLVALREQGRRAVADGDTTKCWLEWSSEPGADPYSEAQWAMACPTLDRPGGISSDFLRLQSETLDRDTFAVEYLSLPGAGPAAHCVDVDAWARAPTTELADQIVLAVDGRPDSQSAAIVAVGRTGDVFGVEVVEQAEGVDWVPARLVDIARRWTAQVVVDRGGPLGWLVPALEHAGIGVVTAGASDVLTAAAGFAVAVATDTVAHDRDPRLDEAVLAAVRRRAGDRWQFDRTSPVDLSPLIAASLGVWALQTRVFIPQIH